MNDTSSIQTLLAEAGLDGWLLFDFRGMNPIAASIAPLPPQAMFSRRWAYWIPVQGEPQWLVHAIELAPFRDRPPAAPSPTSAASTRARWRWCAGWV